MSRFVPLMRSVVAAVIGIGLLGIPTSASAAAPPAAPSALTVSFGSNNIVLAWTDSSANETGFSIERCLGSTCTVFGQISTVGVGAVSYTDIYHASGTNRYRVRAFNSAGYSTYSNIAEISLFSTGDVFPSISAAPTTGQAPLVVIFDGSASVAVNGTISSFIWSFGDNQTTSRAIVSHTYAAPGVYAATLKVTTTGSFGGSTTESTAVIITVTAPPLVAPSDLSATSPVRGQVRLTWTNPVNSATRLTLERCKEAGCTSFTRIAALTTSTTSFVDYKVRRGTTYTYRLAASDSTATVYSNTAVATVRR